MTAQMKKWLLRTLVLLGINVVAFWLAMAAVLVALFKDDPILAAVPALLALPAILLQPWFILFLFVMPTLITAKWFGLLLGLLLTTGVSVLLWAVLDKKGKLDRARRVLARLKNRWTLIGAGCFLACLFAVGYARYVDFPPLRRSMPTFESALNINLGDPRYYCVGQFIDSEWLMRATVSETDMQIMADKRQMQSIPVTQVGDAFWSMPPYWWRPVRASNVLVFSTANFPAKDRGPDGWHAVATWNPADKVLHMWIKDNF